MKVNEIASNKLFGGWQKRLTHASQVCNCDMNFALYLPPAAEKARVPVIYWLSGLTCDDQNFVTKSGAQRVAAELGVALVAPDTSPRGEQVADDPAFDLGQGAGFYVNATQKPWAEHYQMYDYVTRELPHVLAENFHGQLDLSREALAGHSMGGHGALVMGLHLPERFAAVSAFAPICNPVGVQWGEKAFSTYLGDDQSLWREYDASLLLTEKSQAGQLPPIRVEQGLADGFLEEQLKPERLEAAAEHVGADVTVNRRDGYDHSYFFIASFIEEHLRFLAQHLGQ